VCMRVCVCVYVCFCMSLAVYILFLLLYMLPEIISFNFYLNSELLLFLKIQGAFKKFCNLTIKKNGNVTNYTLFFNIIPTEFNACATFFWQTINSTKIEIFRLSLQSLLDSFLERLIVRIADRRSESYATWHDNVKMSTLLQ